MIVMFSVLLTLQLMLTWIGSICSFMLSYFYSAPVGVRSIVINLSVCVSVHEHISGTAGPISKKFCVQIPCGHGSVHLRRHCASLCTFSFMGLMSVHGLNATKYSALWSVARPGRSLMSVNVLLWVFSRHFPTDQIVNIKYWVDVLRWNPC